jgi:hypothetical protein
MVYLGEYDPKETESSPDQNVGGSRRKGIGYIGIAFLVLLSLGAKALLNDGGKPPKTEREIAWVAQRENRADYKWVQSTKDFYTKIGANNEQTERAVGIIHTEDQIKRSSEFERFLENNKWAKERLSIETRLGGYHN